MWAELKAPGVQKVRHGKLEMSVSAGCISFDLCDEATGTTFPVLVMYPSNSPARPTHLGPYTMELANEGALAPGPLIPIVDLARNRRNASGLSHARGAPGA